MSSGGPGDDDSARQRQNIVAAAFLVILTVVGFWLVVAFRKSVEVEVCLEAGHRNCRPLRP